MLHRAIGMVVTVILVSLFAAIFSAPAQAADTPASAISADGLKLLDDMPLVKRALTEPEFFPKLDSDEAAHKSLRKELGDAGFRKFGDTRSVRVEMWRGTSTEQPMILLEYQTSWDRFPKMPQEGTVLYDPVFVGVGRDAMWHRTFYGGTDSAEGKQAFEQLMKDRAALPSNKRTTLDPKFVELAQKYLPSTPLEQVHADVKGVIEKLVKSVPGAEVLKDPQYGTYGAKISDHLYLYLREFPRGAPGRGAGDPFFWLIVAGGPKEWKNDYLPAFPGAEGMGARATGGRGGRVIYVTTLKPTGPGSIGEAFAAKGPRTVLFKVSGQIVMPGGGEDTAKPGENHDLWITEPDLTLIGYTAPGEGVEIKGRFCINADNVIMRGMRWRLRPPFIKDGMSTYGNLKNVIFDHCSFSYDSDEQLRMIGYMSELCGFTIQYCLLGPGLAGTGDHPYGPEVGGFGTFHHNIFYNTLSRSPEVDCDLIDWRNNIMANVRRGHSDRPRSRFNLVGNYFIDIPGNFGQGYDFAKTDAVWESGNVRESGGETQPFGSNSSAYLKHEYAVPPITMEKPEELEAKLLPTIGAYLPARDGTDTFFINELKSRKMKLPYFEKPGSVWRPYGNENDNPQLYEKWDEAACRPPKEGAEVAADAVDSDGDGMPDAWEVQHGFDPKDPSDGAKDADGDGYTNLEEYLNRTDPKVAVDYKDPRNNQHTLH